MIKFSKRKQALIVTIPVLRKPETNIEKILKKGVLGLSILLFVSSLTQKCFCTANECADSFSIFLTGVIGVFIPSSTVTWLANPVLLLAWIFYKKPKIVIWLSLLAFLISLSFLLFSSIVVNEAGQFANITGYKLGYWLWIASSCTMLAGSSISYYLMITR